MKAVLNLIAILFVLGAAGVAQATVVIDPATGRSGDFDFDGTVVTHIDGVPGNDLTISVATDSLLDAFLEDCCVIGDEFALRLDGNVLTPDIANPGDTVNLFRADYFDIFLSAGNHVFEILQTADCCGSGFAFYGFTAATPVPEPGTGLLVGLGTAGLAIWRRPRRR